MFPAFVWMSARQGMQLLEVKVSDEWGELIEFSYNISPSCLMFVDQIILLHS
jgi:hypothetical protein